MGEESTEVGKSEMLVVKKKKDKEVEEDRYEGPNIHPQFSAFAALQVSDYVLQNISNFSKWNKKVLTFFSGDHNDKLSRGGGLVEQFFFIFKNKQPSSLFTHN